MAASGDGAIDAASGAATGGVADSPAGGTAAASLAGKGISGIGDLGPAVRRFVQHQLVQVQAGAEAVFVGGLQDVEGDLRQVFDGRDAVDDNGLVVGQRGQEIAHRVVLFVDRKAWSQTSTKCSLASALMSEKSMIMPLSELPSTEMTWPVSVISSV